jgi:hypothetical protein
MAQLLIALLLSSSVLAPGQAASAPGFAAPPEKAPAGEQKPAAPVLTCRLLTEEGPRGGRLEVEGENFGKSPLVRIAGRVTRMIERTETKIAVQIPRDSNGGPVSVKSGKLEAECGTLTIIGKD